MTTGENQQREHTKPAATKTRVFQAMACHANASDNKKKITKRKAAVDAVLLRLYYHVLILWKLFSVIDRL